MDKRSAEAHRSSTEEETGINPRAMSDNEDSSQKKAEVSSTAIVKYSAVDILPYNWLQQDTDLNVAPSNWLRDGRFSDVDHNRRDPIDLSSFGIAHSFIDSIADVDVISDAENIKKLLKIPYSAKSEVSLAVHRVGQTLLLDSFDVPSFISCASQARGGNVHPRWLYDFYCEQTGIPKDAHFGRKKKNKYQAKLRHIFSKFLHYSIQNNDSQDSSVPSCKPVTSSESAHVDHGALENRTSTETTSPVGPASPRLSDVSAKGSQLFSPIIYEEDRGSALPQLEQESSFQRNVLWQFEDIRMLVGSNLPIFGGGKYPAVSLRLRDCGNPINVLTGLDYWLDNLMCNVPEVAMCYHLDGIVQYYDLYKTEELPNLDGSQFSPKVVKDIAQNILSFMKSNCTREGHTYWLFKESDSEVVKLYDLTSICQQKAEDNTETFFTVPVAMLLYRVAKNMMNQGLLGAMEQGTVCQLLNNCLLLLDSERFPEIYTSANYLLSDLYSPDEIHALPALDRRDQEETTDGEKSYIPDLDPAGVVSCGSEGNSHLVVKSLDVTKLSAPRTFQGDWIKVSKPLPSNVEERCKVALSHITKGLACLKGDLPQGVTQEEVLNSSTTESPPHNEPSSPSRASNIAAETTASSSSPQAVVPSYTNRLEPYGKKKTPLIVIRPTRWQEKSANLLLRKAAAVYHSLACVFNTEGKYGRGLKNCKFAFKCLNACQSFDGGTECKDVTELLISVMYVSGDAYLMLSKCQENLAVHQEDFRFMSEVDKMISQVADEYLVDESTHFAEVKFMWDVEKNLLKSVGLYDAARELVSESTKEELVVNLTRRLGNVKNEIGVFYMNEAAALMCAGQQPGNDEQNLWKKSFSNFESGIRLFEATDDCANKALLLSNLGRLMRLCAQAVGGVENKATGTRGEFSQEERGYFNKAFEFYNRALRCLAERKTCSEVWDTVTWELSGTYFSMATLLQDFAPLSTHAQEQIEQDVTELMMKALRLCEPSASRSVLQVRPQSQEQLQQRIATIHHRLASLYHNSYRNQAVDHAKKKARSLAELHYSKSTIHINYRLYPCEWIRIQLERVAMCEYHVTLHGGSVAAKRILHTALDYLFLTREALESVVEFKSTLSESGSLERNESQGECLHTESLSSLNFEELNTLIPILESRITSVLKELVKITSTSKKGKGLKDRSGLDTAKRMYSVALRGCAAHENRQLIDRCQGIAETLKNLAEIEKDG